MLNRERWKIGALCAVAAAAALGAVVRGGPAQSQPGASVAPPTAAAGKDAVGKDVTGKDVHATVFGQEVLLKADGTWHFVDGFHGGKLEAISDLGEHVTLRETKAADGTVTRSWTPIGHGGGPIQVVITRALTTDANMHRQGENCMPVVQVRNLTDVGLKRMVVEIEFSSGDGEKSGASFMLGDLDDGEAGEKAGPALFVADCKSLTGTVHVPYCAFEDGVPCENLVVASNHGLIPLYMAPAERRDAGAGVGAVRPQQQQQ
jgi:hypothetical protein